jgi:hypothetical protein
VRRRRGLDATSLAVGVTTTLLVLGLGFALWSYTVARRTPAEPAVQPAPRSAPARTAPAPRPSAPPAAARERAPAPAPPAPAPAVVPRATNAAQPSAALTPALAPSAVAPPTAAAPAKSAPAKPAPALAAPPAQAAPPAAAAAPALVQQDFSLASFELPPAVEHFLGDWLDALAADDRAQLGALGFPNEPSTLAGSAGHRDGFRLAAADIDETRSHGGRVYLRVVVSYAFTDASGRFRTQDEQRLILSEAGGRLRFEGRWQQ